MSDKLDKTLALLWERSSFTSYFYQNITFVKNSHIPTFALTIISSRLTFFYNNKFLEELDTEEFIGLLIHEMLHIVHNHNHRQYNGDLQDGKSQAYGQGIDTGGDGEDEEH